MKEGMFYEMWTLWNRKCGWRTLLQRMWCGPDTAEWSCESAGLGQYMNNTKTAPNQNYSNITPSQVGDMGDYQPISMWGYFGYELLFAIPCVGFVLLLVFSFGGTKNVNLRNFARSYFCFTIVVFVLMLFLFFSSGMAGMMGRMYY